MDYEIVTTVNEVSTGEEIFKRAVALPEQVPLLRQDIEAAIGVYEDKIQLGAESIEEMEENYRIREEGE